MMKINKKNVCQGIIDFVTVAEPMYDAWDSRRGRKVHWLVLCA